MIFLAHATFALWVAGGGGGGGKVLFSLLLRDKSLILTDRVTTISSISCH